MRICVHGWYSHTQILFHPMQTSFVYVCMCVCEFVVYYVCASLLCIMCVSVSFVSLHIGLVLLVGGTVTTYLHPTTTGVRFDRALQPRRYFHLGVRWFGPQLEIGIAQRLPDSINANVMPGREQIIIT